MDNDLPTHNMREQQTLEQPSAVEAFLLQEWQMDCLSPSKVAGVDFQQTKKVDSPVKKRSEKARAVEIQSSGPGLRFLTMTHEDD
jgi:hypothetical protein